MASESVFVQDFGVAWLRDPLVVIGATSGPEWDHAQRRCRAPARLHRFGAASPNPVAQLASTGLSALENKVEMLFGLLVFGAIVGAVFAFVGVYNRLIAASEKATRAWNDLDALLRQRHDEIPKLLEACEPHLGGERALLDRVLETRAEVFAARQARDADALGRAEADLREAATTLMARAAAHPSLVASPAFSLLRQRQATLDVEIRDRRDGYNDAVRQYNTATGRIPGNLVAFVGAFPRLRPLDFERAHP
jgi:LemA protein